MIALGHALRAFPSLLRIAVAEMVAYRAEMIIWILTATLPLVMLALWNAAAAEGPLAGFGQAEFARYFGVTLLVRQLTGVWVLWELNQQIRTGALSPALLRPMNPLWWQFAETVAAVPWRVLVLVPVLALVALWRPEIIFVPTPTAALGFGVSLVFALLVAWFVQCLFGILAFWFDQSLGLFQVWFFVWAVLGGYLVPLPLLPAPVAAAAAWLPFHASLGAPVELLLGLAPVGPTLAVQAGWVAILGLATMFTWRAGLRRYGAVGA
ncbi:MAG: ABC-2 family transporter protein [Pseudomonadota bacterium]|nr:ABC-2 family transporter protein [Pseudomonadota bacterium]